jgi:hypothetical protein
VRCCEKSGDRTGATRGGAVIPEAAPGGRRVNHKRVDRLWAEARLQVRRRRRKKVPWPTVSRSSARSARTRCGRRTSCSLAPPMGGY